MARVNVRDAVRLLILERHRRSESVRLSIQAALAQLKLCGSSKLKLVRRWTRGFEVPNTIELAVAQFNDQDSDVESIESCDSDVTQIIS